MIIEMHLLQNFAPSNLNRDDTGSPKDCEFGGHRRARISSQSFKRAIRTKFRADALIDASYLAERTKRAGADIARRLVAAGKPEDVAQQVANALLGGAKLEVKEGKTAYLLFLSERELQSAADLCLRQWDQLSDLITQASGQASGQPGEKASGKAKAQIAIPADIKNAFERALDGGQAVDLALFGRMIADLPDHNVEAACQVAHAISTNRINMEFDFYTAVDDLRPGDTAGADMLGTVEFNSACFYRYACLDTTQLTRNLKDAALTRNAIAAFMRAFVTAIPTGKQNSMAAHNLPSLVMAVVRDSEPWNLANAFLRPVAPSASADLVQASIGALASYWGRLSAMYPTTLRGAWLATTEPDQLQSLGVYRVPSVQEVIARTINAIDTIAPAAGAAVTAGAISHDASRGGQA